MKELILNYFHFRQRKQLKIDQIEDWVVRKLGRKAYQKQGGYEEFARQVEGLVAEGKIQPIKARGKNGLKPELYNGYRLLSTAQLAKEVKQKLLTQYHPAISTTYYLNNPADYRQDQGYLELLDQFLKETNQLAPMSVNERSFQIFKREKFLASRRGSKFLQRIGLTLDDLNCYQTAEPFFYYAQPGVNGLVTALIIENKDTFFSFKTLLQEEINSWGGTEFDLLIYGEGRKIQHSFSFFHELKQYQVEETDFYYFGDLDPEGIMIWYGLQEAEEVEFKPALFFYRLLMDKYKETPKLTTGQRFNQEAVDEFSTYFSAEFKKQLNKLLAEDRYLPQEGLNYALLKEVSGGLECG